MLSPNMYSKTLAPTFNISALSSHPRVQPLSLQKELLNTVLELLVFGAPRFGQESLSQLLQVPRVICLDLCLLAEEILQVLQQLDPELALLVKAFQLLYELGTDL